MSEVGYSAAGFTFAPYVPLVRTPVVLDPESFVPRRGLLTRYSPRLLREGARYYSNIALDNRPVMLDDGSSDNRPNYVWDFGDLGDQQLKETVNWKKEGF